MRRYSICLIVVSLHQLSDFRWHARSVEHWYRLRRALGALPQWQILRCLPNGLFRLCQAIGSVIGATPFIMDIYPVAYAAAGLDRVGGERAL